MIIKFRTELQIHNKQDDLYDYCVCLENKKACNSEDEQYEYKKAEYKRHYDFIDKSIEWKLRDNEPEYYNDYANCNVTVYTSEDGEAFELEAVTYWTNKLNTGGDANGKR